MATPDPIGIEDDMFMELGRAITHWTHLEIELGEFLSWLIQGIPGRMYVITQNVPAASISNWIRVLSEQHFTSEENLAYLRQLLADIDETRGERNGFVHGLWQKGPEPMTALVRTVRLERAELIKDELVTLSDLRSFTERADEFYVRIIHLGGQFGWRPSLPDPTPAGGP